MVQPIEIIDHVDNSSGKYLSQYQGSVKLKNFTSSFLEELDEIENEFNLFRTTLILANALGVNLDEWGDILQSGQRPVNDDEFRVLLYALIGAYNSEGRPEDIRSIVLTAVNADSIFIQDNADATFSFTLFNPTFTFSLEFLSQIVNLAKPLGVEFIGYIVSNIYTDPSFSFVGDIREGSAGFAIALSPWAGGTPWANYIAPVGTNRMEYSVDGDLVTIDIYTAAGDTQWRDDITNNYLGTTGAIIGFDSVSDSDFYHITTLSTTGTVIHNDEGAFFKTQFVLIDALGNTLSAFSQNRNVLSVPNGVSAAVIADITYTDADPLTLYQTLTTAALNLSDFYTNFAFAAPATIGTTDRVKVSGSVGTDLVLEISQEAPSATNFAQELFNEIGSVNGSYIGLEDVNGVQWVVQSNGSMTIANESPIASARAFQPLSELLLHNWSEPEDFVAQSFRVTETGLLSQIKIFLQKTGSPTGTIDCKVYDWAVSTDPDNGTLVGTSDVFTAESISSGFNTTINFSTPLSIVANQTYWFILRYTDPGGGGTFVNTGNKVDPYGTDTGYDGGDRNLGESLFASALGGVFWQYSTTRDWAFDLTVEPDGVYTQTNIEIVSGGVSNALAIFKDGASSTEQDMLDNFAAFDETNSAEWTANNPSGFGKEVGFGGINGAYGTTDGGRYSLLI